MQIIKDQYAMGGRFLMESPGLMMTGPRSAAGAHVLSMVASRRL